MPLSRDGIVVGETRPDSDKIDRPAAPSKIADGGDAADNWKPSKKKSRERIDGVVALIMALERATCDLPVKSLYDDHTLEIG